MESNAFNCFEIRNQTISCHGPNRTWSCFVADSRQLFTPSDVLHRDTRNDAFMWRVSNLVPRRESKVLV